MTAPVPRVGEVNSSRGVCDRYHEHGLPQPSVYNRFVPESMKTYKHDDVVALRVCLNQCDPAGISVAQSGHGWASPDSTVPSSEAHSGMRQKRSVPMVQSGALR